MDNKTLPKQTWKLITITIGAVIALSLVLWVWGALTGPTSEYLFEAAEVDRVTEEKVEVDVTGGTEKETAGTMSELSLALPDSSLLSNNQLSLIGYNLGLTNESSIEVLGDQVIWREGVKRLVIDRKRGTISFSTGFNLEAMTVEGVADVETAMTTLRTFFVDSNLPTINYDFDAATASYFFLDSNGDLSESGASDGSLIKFDVPYEYNDTKMFLPVKTTALVGADGQVYQLSTVLLNIRPSGRAYKLLSWSTARATAENGNGAVIAGEFNENMVIDQSYPAYYLSMKEFYGIDNNRAFTPVYVFENSGGTLIVPATK